tara:strand:+ start:9383 stop:12223 length:2841 start_codon:yes stop_codon:yes gene_type:complete
MKNNFAKSITILFIALGMSLTGFSQVDYKQMMNDPSFNFYDVCEAAELYFESHDKGKGSGWKPYQRWKAENESKYYPSGDRSKSSSSFAANEFKAFQKQQILKTARDFNSTQWKELGPWNANNITQAYNPGIGRVEAFWVNPTNNQHLFLGSRSGGFWKTTDGGANWVNTTDTLIASGVNTIAVNPFSTDTVLINVKNAANNTSHGIYRSTDGGTNWVESNFNPTQLGWGGLGTNDQIFKIVYHPRVRGLVFVGTSSGVYRSTDHLQTWTRLLNTADVTDIEFHPTNDSIIYLYDNYYFSNNENQVVRSLDQGLTYSASSTISGNSGSKIFIAVTPMAPNNVYVASTNGVWKSTDNGQNFSLLSTPSESCDGFSVSDIDSNDMVYGYLNLMGSTDGGLTFQEIASWSNSNPTNDYTHADLRTAECINGVFYVGTDGYLAKTPDNGATWARLNDGTAIREFYAAGVSQSYHNVFMAGSQDNGTSVLNDQGWIEWNGGDGMEAIVQTLNPDWMIGSWQYGTRQITLDGGQTRQGAGNPDAGSGNAAWQAPLLWNPIHQMRVYHFAEKIYVSQDFGTNWSELADPGVGLINVAAIAENNSDIMAVSGGSSMMLTTDNWATQFRPNFGLPNASITDIAFDPKHDSTIIVTFNRYVLDGKKVYISTDLGSTWTNISYNLRDMPIRSVVVDYSDSSYIYLGAEIGVYVKSMNGTNWELYSNGLPNVTVKDLEIQYGSNTLKAATWGRGLWEYSLKGRENYPTILTTKITETPSNSQPRAGFDQDVTAIISYNQQISSAFVRWSNSSIDLGKTITMSNVSDSTWVTDEPFTNYGQGTEMYFKVFAVGQNNDTTETYRFHYTVRQGLNVNSIIENNFESEVNVFPIPNAGKFTVKLGENYKDVKLEVFDVNGKSIYQRIDTGSEFDISLKAPVGSYILKVTSGKKEVKVKFVIK